MTSRVDITGEVNGMLTAVSYVGKHPSSKRSVWVWRCECGTEFESTVSSVRIGNRKSCGCQRLQKLKSRLSERSRKEVNESCKNTLLYRYKKEAAARGFVFLLDSSEFFDLTQAPCHYCSTPPSNRQQVAWNTDIYVYSGVDRIDSSVGYVTGNVVPCCSTCNTAKNTMSYVEFKNWIERVYKNMLGSV